MEPRTSGRLETRRRWDDKATGEDKEERVRQREGGGSGSGGGRRQVDKKLKERNGMRKQTGKRDGAAKRKKNGRQLGPVRTEQLLRPICSSTKPRLSLA